MPVTFEYQVHEHVQTGHGFAFELRLVVVEVVLEARVIDQRLVEQFATNIGALAAAIVYDFEYRFVVLLQFEVFLFLAHYKVQHRIIHVNSTKLLSQLCIAALRNPIAHVPFQMISKMSFRIVESFARNRVSTIEFSGPLRTLASIMVRLAEINHRIVHFATLETRVCSTIDPSDFAIAAMPSRLHLLLLLFGFNFQLGLNADFV